MARRPVGRPLPGSVERHRATRRAVRRRGSRAGALPRGHFEHAALRVHEAALVDDAVVARLG
eukprot:scaffold38563_cov39-Phaeocystis_antarctica.AAC.3